MCDVCACDVCVFVCLYIFMILGANTYIRNKGIGPNDFVLLLSLFSIMDTILQGGIDL